MPRQKKGDNIKQVVYLPKPLHKRLRLEAFKREVSRSALMVLAVEKYFGNGMVEK